MVYNVNIESANNSYKSNEMAKHTSSICWSVLTVSLRLLIESINMYNEVTCDNPISVSK